MSEINLNPTRRSVSAGLVLAQPFRYERIRRLGQININEKEAANLDARALFGEFASAARKANIRVIARLDPNYAFPEPFEAHPDWFTRDRNGYYTNGWRSAGLGIVCSGHCKTEHHKCFHADLPVSTDRTDANAGRWADRSARSSSGGLEPLAGNGSARAHGRGLHGKLGRQHSAEVNVKKIAGIRNWMNAGRT
jgi:hypothetical protein